MPEPTAFEHIGPTVCESCRNNPTTVWDGQGHPLCTGHRGQLVEMFEKFPERQVVWEGSGWSRTYAWVEKVNENKDQGAPGDLDPEGRLKSRSIHDLHATGAISRDTVKRLLDLKSKASDLNLRARIGTETL